MSIRKEFVTKALSGETPIAQLCREYGISRKTGYKWIGRFQQRGFDALVDESRRPNSSPSQVSIASTMDVVQLRKQHPTWGPRKLQALMAKRLAGDDLPSVRTIARILNRGSLTKKRRYRPSSKGLPFGPPKYVVEAPNDLWTADFKGWWFTTDGKKCEPLTVRDAYSRMILVLRILGRTRTEEVQRVFEQLFQTYGLPKAIQTDNGPPFASIKALGGLTKLSAWWMSMGIEVIRSRPGCPQDNGGHERMHADVRAEVQTKRAASLPEQQAICDAWRLEFNHVRPHEALGMRTPAELYRPSERRPSHVIVGGSQRGIDTRIVGSNGAVNYMGKGIYVSLALPGYPVAFEHQPTELRVWFYDRLLGTVPFSKLEQGNRLSVEPMRLQVASPDIAAVSPGAEVTCDLSPRDEVSPGEVTAVEVDPEGKQEVTELEKGQKKAAR